MFRRYNIVDEISAVECFSDDKYLHPTSPFFLIENPLFQSLLQSLFSSTCSRFSRIRGGQEGEGDSLGLRFGNGEFGEGVRAMGRGGDIEGQGAEAGALLPP